MFIAQKTLKSMPSTTTDINQDNDDMDDFLYTPKSGAVSPVSSPSMAHIANDEMIHSELSTAGMSHSMMDSSEQNLIEIDQTQDELQAFVATSTTYREPEVDQRSKSIPYGSIDAFDYQ